MRLSKKKDINPILETSQKPKRILLGHLGSYGDCLFATTIAHQIKKDYPDCHLTWAIGSAYKSILDGNPYVDQIWEIPLSNYAQMFDAWQKLEREAWDRKKCGEFDEIFLTQIDPDNYQNFDGTVRSSIFRAYPRPITVPDNPIIRLSPKEVEKVRQFIEAYQLSHKSNVILFEHLANSGQSFVSQSFALQAAEKLVEKFQNISIILSSHNSVQSSHPSIVDGSILSFRENAELTKYCSLLIGCSSGISWLSTSDWARPLPMIQLLRAYTSVFASFVYDYKYRGLPTNSIIEMTECSPDRLVECVSVVLTEGFDNAWLKFHECIPLRFEFYCESLGSTIRRGKYNKAIHSLFITIKRYGLRPQMISAIFYTFFKFRKKLLSQWKSDLKRVFTKIREEDIK